MNQILAIFSAILAALAYGFVKGKKSIELLENEEAAKQVQEKNKYVDEANKLSDDELDKRVRKYTKKPN
jgi:sensor domain CHASE-containing protein